MVDLAEIQAAYYMVAATGVLVAAIYYVMTLRTTQTNMKQTLETRQAQFMMQLNENMTNVEVMKRHIELMNMEWTDLDDFEKKYGTGTNIDAAAKRWSFWWRFGFIGDLLQRNLVDREWLHESFSSIVIPHWFKWEPLIKQTRKLINTPSFGSNFEYLAQEMMKMDEQKGIKRRILRTYSYEDAHLGKIEPSKTV